MIFNQELTKSYFEHMLTIRYVEEALADEWDKGLVPGMLHLACGHEAVAVGVACQLNNHLDQITASHRGHGAAIAIGVPLVPMISEVLGLNGLNGGFGGTQHIASPKHGFLTANGIVGGQVPLAAGAALSAKIQKTGGIAVTFLGDGAINQGCVLETLNLAKILSLPLLFVIEDNGMGATIGSAYSTAGEIENRARAVNMQSYSVDGADILAVVDTATQAVASVRSGGGPAMIVARVKRLDGHYYSDPQNYRSPQEFKQAREHHDPIERLSSVMMTMGWSLTERNHIEHRVKARITQAVEQAHLCPQTDEQYLAFNVYGGVAS
jgi:acetoin:2,6-dichlorophenolindophenol oxidoreductase subunit alpha